MIDVSYDMRLAQANLLHVRQSRYSGPVMTAVYTLGYQQVCIIVDCSLVLHTIFVSSLTPMIPNPLDNIVPSFFWAHGSHDKLGRKALKWVSIVALSFKVTVDGEVQHTRRHGKSFQYFTYAIRKNTPCRPRQKFQYQLSRS